jgi:hypothetical protein
VSADAHARSSGGSPESIYDVSVPTLSHAERARTLVEGHRGHGGDHDGRRSVRPRCIGEKREDL